VSAVAEPYVDLRGSRSRPFAVLLRGGRTGRLVEVRRFARPEDAWAFYEEHRPGVAS
jgi:hypothetical protein